MTITVTPELLALTRQLVDAKTIGEIFAIPMPQTLGPLSKPNLLAGFYSASGSTRMKADITASGFMTVAESGDLDVDQIRAASEPVDITTEFSAAVVEMLRMTPAPVPKPGWFRRLRKTGLFGTANHQQTAPMPAPSWKGEMEIYMSGREEHGSLVHFDHPEAKPNDLVGLAVSANGLLVLPHTSAAEIIKKSEYAHILDLKLSDPYLDQKLLSFYMFAAYDRISNKFREAMIECPANSFNLNTGMTIHTQPAPVSHNRVCSKVVMHYSRS